LTARPGWPCSHAAVRLRELVRSARVKFRCFLQKLWLSPFFQPENAKKLV
jgi:hypothetical protein